MSLVSGLKNVSIIELDCFTSWNRTNVKSFGLDIGEKSGRLCYDIVDTRLGISIFWRDMGRSKQICLSPVDKGKTNVSTKGLLSPLRTLDYLTFRQEQHGPSVVCRPWRGAQPR